MSEQIPTWSEFCKWLAGTIIMTVLFLALLFTFGPMILERTEIPDISYGTIKQTLHQIEMRREAGTMTEADRRYEANLAEFMEDGEITHIEFDVLHPPKQPNSADIKARYR